MDNFDPFFYHNFYKDLQSIEKNKLKDHYEKNGIQEKRIKNIFEFIE